MSQTHNKSTLIKVIQESMDHFRLPFIFAFILHAIFVLQTSSLIFHTGFLSQNSQDEFVPFQLIEKVLSVTHFYNVFAPSQSLSLICAFLTLAISILAFLFSMFFLLAFMYKNSKKPNPILLKLFMGGNTLHYHVLFYPIHYFCVKFLFSYNDCSGLDTPAPYCQAWCLSIVILCFLVNIIWAVFQAIYFFQMQTDDNPLAAKSNIFPLLSVVQKSICLPIGHLTEGIHYIGAVLNFLFCLMSVYLLQKRLLYFNFKILKLTMIINTMNTTLAVAMIAVQFQADVNKTGLVWMMTTILIIKLFLIRLNLTFERIIRLEFKNPIEAVHFPALLDNYIDNFAVIEWQKRVQKRGSFYFHGLVNSETPNKSKLQNEDSLINLKNEIYHSLMERYNILLQANPKNVILILAMTHIYIEHLEDVPQAIKFLSKLAKENSSVSVRIAINLTYNRIEKLLLQKNQTKSKSEWIHYLTNQKSMTIIKEEIQKEISEHVAFWSQLKNDKINAKELDQKAGKIDLFAKKIEKIWDETSGNLIAGFPTARLMYGIYLDLIRGYPYQGMSLLRTGREVLLNKKDQNNTFSSMLSDKTAIITASIEPDKTGQVLDASFSVNQLFNIQRENLIGSHINIVLPKIISERHDFMIKNYVKNFRYNFDNRFNSYAKTIDGEYFSVDMNLRINPCVQKGLSVVAYVKKSSEKIPLLIVDSSGKILEYSKDIQSQLNLKSRSEGLSLHSLCPEIVRYTLAMNIVYFSKNAQEITETKKEEEVDVDNDTEREKEDDFGSENFLSSPPSPLEIKGFSTAFYDKFNPGKRMNSLLSSQRELLLSQRPRESLFASVIKANIEKSFLSNTFDSNFYGRSSSRGLTARVSLNQEVAERLCDEMKEGRKFTMSPINNTNKSLEYLTQIEPIVVGGEFFMVIKLRQVTASSKRKERKARKSEVKIKESQPSQGFAESFQTEDEYSESRYSKILTQKDEISKNEENEVTTRILVINNKEEDKGSENSKEEGNSSVRSHDSHTEHVEMSNIDHFQPQESETNPSSIRDLKKKNTAIIKQLNEVFTKKKSKIVSYMYYQGIFLTAVILAILFTINLVFTQSSLREIESDVVLLDAVDNRLYKSIVAWQGLLSMYLISVGIRPSTIMDFFLKSNLITYSKDMTGANQLLGKQVALSEGNIVKSFYAKTIAFWEPDVNSIYNSNDNLDSFAASQILFQKYLYVGNFPRSLSWLNNDDTMLFAINNTVNDYLLKAEADTIRVQNIVNKSVETNIILLVVFFIIEIFFLMRIVWCLGVSIRNIYFSHKKMLRALSKIKTNAIDERINLLQRITSYLNKDLDSPKWYLMPLQENLTNKVAKKDDFLKQKDLTQKLIIKDIVFHLLKHSFVIFVFIFVLSTLGIVNFFHSTDDFHALESMNDKLTVTHKLGSDIAMLLPTYYFLTIFQNQTNFKIRNEDPRDQLLKNLELLSNANQLLLSVLADSNEGITDPVIIEVLNKNICDKLPSLTRSSCRTETKSNSFGLLGLNLKYYQGCYVLMQNYLNNPTRANAENTYDLLVEYSNNLPTVLRRSYEYLTKYYLNIFHDVTQSKLSNTYTYFIILLILNFIGALLIRVITVKELGRFDIAPRKVLKLVPFWMIQDSRIMTFYIKNVFGQELGNVLRFL